MRNYMITNLDDSNKDEIENDFNKIRDMQIIDECKFLGMLENKNKTSQILQAYFSELGNFQNISPEYFENFKLFMKIHIELLTEVLEELYPDGCIDPEIIIKTKDLTIVKADEGKESGIRIAGIKNGEEAIIDFSKTKIEIDEGEDNKVFIENMLILMDCRTGVFKYSDYLNEIRENRDKIGELAEVISETITLRNPTNANKGLEL